MGAPTRSQQFSRTRGDAKVTDEESSSASTHDIYGSLHELREPLSHVHQDETEAVIEMGSVAGVRAGRRA